MISVVFEGTRGSTSIGSRPTTTKRVKFAERSAIPYQLLSDPGLAAAAALRLPTFSLAGQTFYRRITLVAESGIVVKAFYPVFPPDIDAERVIGWLRSREM